MIEPADLGTHVSHQSLRAPDRGLEARAEHPIDGLLGHRFERLVLQRAPRC